MDNLEEKLLKVARELFCGGYGHEVKCSPFGDDFIVNFRLPKTEWFAFDLSVEIALPRKKVHCCTNKIELRDVLYNDGLYQMFSAGIDRDRFDAARTSLSDHDRRSAEAGAMIDDAFRAWDAPDPSPEPEVTALSIVERQVAAVRRLDWSIRMLRRLEVGKTWGDMLAEEDRLRCTRLK